MKQYKHLSKEQRSTIENLLNKGESFTDIAEAINYDRTCISKEVRRNRYIKAAFYLEYSTDGITKAIKGCDKLSKPPYCCNSCKSKCFCSKYHLYYNANVADKHYKDTLVKVREGADITEEEVSIINKDIVPLVKNKKQSVNQIYNNHRDILYFSKSTFYTYVNNNVINLTNGDLPRKIRYKKRKKVKNKTNKREIALLINRKYEDYLTRINENSKLNIWQLDTVIGMQEDEKCLMTFLLVETNFMMIRLLNKKNVECINNVFTELKSALGSEIYKQVIEIILTDNGTEFYDPVHIENNLDTGEKLCSLYYCHPNSPEEKSELEKNHEYIRYVLPKKTSFNNLTCDDVKRLEDNINNIPRDIFGGKTPYELTKEKFPSLIERINSNYILPDDVSLNKNDIILN